MAIPKGGYFTPGAGTVWPDLPQDTGLLWLLDHREDHPWPRAGLLRICPEHRKGSGRTTGLLAVLKLHYLRWVLFPIKGETYFMYQGIFDTDFDKYTEDAVAIFAVRPQHGL